jgi:OFA family oxalate/formate antiporter-like MFS transporter
MPAITQNKQGLRVLITGSILQLFLGILYVWSVFVNPVSEVYAWDVDSVKLTSSFMLCFFVVGILVGGKLQIKAGAQRIVLTGGLMLSAGMLATAFLTPASAWLMYVTYGIIGGFGVGAAYNAIISCAQKWFPQNRGFATGVSVCAFGFSTVIFAPLIEALVSQFGLKSAFLILAAAFFAVVLALFNFIRLPDESAEAGAPSAALLAKKQYTVTEAIKTREFYYITLSLMLATAAFFILNPSFKSFAAERGLDESIGTVIVMMTGVANALGRLGAPLLSDKMGREKAAFTIILMTAVCALLLCFAKGFLFMATVAVISFCYGGYSGIYPVLTADYFGIKNVGSNYGAVMVGFAVSALTFPLIISLIASVTIKFFVLASLAAVGVILMVLLMMTKSKDEFND